MPPHRPRPAIAQLPSPARHRRSHARARGSLRPAASAAALSDHPSSDPLGTTTASTKDTSSRSDAVSRPGLLRQVAELATRSLRGAPEEQDFSRSQLACLERAAPPRSRGGPVLRAAPPASRGGRPTISRTTFKPEVEMGPLKLRRLVTSAVAVVAGGCVLWLPAAAPAAAHHGRTNWRHEHGGSHHEESGHLVVSPSGSSSNSDASCAQAGFSTIQSAVAAAAPSSTVMVCAGTYAEDVTVARR